MTEDNTKGGHGIQETYQLSPTPGWVCRSPTLVVAYLVSQVTNCQPGITYSQPHDHQEWKKSDVVKLDG